MTNEEIKEKLEKLEEKYRKSKKKKYEWKFDYFILLLDDNDEKDYEKYYKKYNDDENPYEKWIAELAEKGFIERKYRGSSPIHFDYILRLKGIEWLKKELNK